MLYAGAALFGIFLSKQNFGGGIFLISLIPFLSSNFKQNKYLLINYIAGIASLGFCWLFFLIYTDSLSDFIRNLDAYTIQRILINKTLNTSFIYENTLLIKIGKGLIYASPLIFSIFAYSLTLKSKTNLRVIPLFIGFFYLLGIRPTTDYLHLVPLLAISSLSMVIILTNVKNKFLKNILLLYFVFMIGLGFFRAFFGGYYKWDWALYHNNYFTNYSPLYIYLTKEKADETLFIKKYILSHSDHNDNIFVNYYSPFIYFLTDRKNPTPYDLVSPLDLPIDYQKNALEVLKSKNVPLVIMHRININEDSILANHIYKNYPVKKNIGGYIIFTQH